MRKFKMLVLSVTLVLMAMSSHVIAQRNSPLKIVSYDLSNDQPGFHNAVYLSRNGFKLRSRNAISDDGGSNWHDQPTNPGSIFRTKEERLTPVTSVYDPNRNYLVTFFNALDHGNVGEARLQKEPVIGQVQYYLRYRVSSDSGKSWLFEKPVFQQGNGYSKEHSFDGITMGQNAIYVGDLGSVPIITKSGKILLPVETTLADNNGRLFNRGGGSTYMDVLVLIGSWNQDGTISWTCSERIKGDPQRTTRGLIEPTIVELNDGRIAMVARGSNGGSSDRGFNIPGYKWISISSDGGMTWAKPTPMTYNDNTPFYSPSSMSVLFRHSSGRFFWVGNITDSNPRGNGPRFPLVMGEVSGTNGKLIRSSVITLDSIKPSDADKGQVDISHATIIEDRKTKEMVITYQRNYGNYKSREWATVRVAI